MLTTPSSYPTKSREAYIALLIERERVAFCAKRHQDWRKAIERVKAVERHLRRVNDYLSDQEWLTAHGFKVA
jgi:hypothetical protein